MSKLIPNGAIVTKKEKKNNSKGFLLFKLFEEANCFQIYVYFHLYIPNQSHEFFKKNISRIYQLNKNLNNKIQN